MKRQFVTISIALVIFVFMVTSAFALNDFTRVLEIPVPEADLNNGGIGGMISGVDVDGDGKREIYLVNDNWEDGTTEVIPRIYKLEFSGTDWEVVWHAVIEPFYQNTWPCLSIADLDKDGKEELVWGPVNSTSVTANPDRIVVYEHAGGDVFGIDNGDGTYSPNSTWTIVTEDNVNLRPMDWSIADIDNDGVEEIIFADRKGNDGGYYLGVCSVDDIPDNADGTETWTLEVSGKDFGLTSAVENKWDVAVIGNSAYVFSETEISKLSYNGTTWEYTGLSPMVGGSSVQAAQVVDLDEDGTQEIITAVYDWGDDDHKAIMLLQEDGDTLKHTELVNTNSYFSTTTRGLWGGASGDIDQDGYLDFVFGSRAGDVNARIFMFSYKGGDITDSLSYDFSVIDEAYVDEDGIWGVINIANIDDDAELEVLYTSSASYGGALGVHGSSAPIIVLDEEYTVSDLVIAEEVLLNGEIPSGYLFKPGRIMDDGNIIWFMGVDGTNKETYVFRSVDGGKTFTHNSTPIAGRGAQLDAYDADVALVSTANGRIFKTSDGGANWSEVYSYSLGLGDGWFDGLRVLNATVAIAFGDEAANGDMHFVRTVDQGDNWTEITGIDYLDAAYGYYTWGLGSCNVGDTIWCAGLTAEYDSGYVFRSYDAGVTWDSYKIPSDTIDLYPRSIAFYDGSNGLITDRYGSIIKSTDGGETWSKVSMHPNAGCANGAVAVPNTNTIMVLDDNGVFSTSDLGETWEQIVTPWATSDDYFVSGVFLNEEFGYLFTYYGQVLRFADQIPSSIDDQLAGLQPEQFSLLQNYPNPFNPTTTISFAIPTISRTEVVIYDLLGCEVVTLIDKKLTQGKYSVVWNGRDKYGKQVSTGVYIYQLRANDIVLSKRMLLIK